jgi:mannose-1-phosphate guanylyltransferase/mannose-1-phosphate guanylyltransferase/mannose-6-phosphate isomerase
MSERRITPVILSGGAGTRLWPLSRLDRVKPHVALTGARTLLQETALRVSDRERFETPLLVVGEEHAATSAAQLDEVGIAASTLVEPCPRGTAAAVALAACHVPDALLLVLPSDHLIADEGAFQAALAAAVPLAEEGWLVTFGVTPDRPETGYGYIRTGDPLGGGFKAAAFVEKPPRALAENYVAQGGYLWNAGIFLFRAGAFLQALEASAPDIFTAVRAFVSGEGPGAFAAAPPGGVDRAVLEKSERVAVVPAEMGWSDVGSWEALWALGPRDEAGNLLSGDVVAPSSTGCLIRSDGPALVALDVHDLVIVATERAVLVVPRGQSQRVKEAIDALQAREQKAPRP